MAIDTSFIELKSKKNLTKVLYHFKSSQNWFFSCDNFSILIAKKEGRTSDTNNRKYVFKASNLTLHEKNMFTICNRKAPIFHIFLSIQNFIHGRELRECRHIKVIMSENWKLFVWHERPPHCHTFISEWKISENF